MAFAMPLVIPQKRTTTATGARVSLLAEINAQSLADLHSMIVGITGEEAANQERLGNPPQLIEVDNRTNKPLDQAKGKVVVLFGVALAAAAMRMVETELRAAITRTTVTRSGRLANVGGNWQWRFIPRGSAARIVSSASPPPTFGRGDMLVLSPATVPYATAVNRAVANAARIKTRATKKYSSQSIGFLAAAARAVRRKSEFKQFSVVVEFTKAHAVPGEVYSHGSGVITIRPRLRSVRA